MCGQLCEQALIFSKLGVLAQPASYTRAQVAGRGMCSGHATCLGKSIRPLMLPDTWYEGRTHDRKPWRGAKDQSWFALEATYAHMQACVRAHARTRVFFCPQGQRRIGRPMRQQIFVA